MGAIKIAISTSLILMLLHFQVVQAQLLSRKEVSLNLQEVALSEALAQLNSMEGIKLSYNPDLISTDRLITKTYENEPIEKVLYDLLGNQFEYKYRGSYIIIQQMRAPEAEKTDFTFSGAVKDAATGENIEDVTIYEVNKLSSTLTDTDGAFELNVSAKTKKVTFSISRENYQDTLIQVSDLSELSQAISLRPLEVKEQKQTTRLEIETKKLVQFFTTKKSRKNARNVDMEEERFFQLSLVPMVGTNGLLSGQVTNKFSVNLFAGYSYGLNGFELGGFYNINRMETRGLQIGGFGNASGGETKGVQIGGFLNTTKGYTTGVQTAGFFNLVSDDVKGLQLAGFLNIAKETTGSQIGGFTNIATRSANGLQLSGFYNSSQDLTGSQVSGFINIAKEMKGLQLSGFVNYAKKVRGVQLGVINIADTVESGITFGLLNLVRTGKHQVALEHNEVMDLNASFRSGTDRFYSVLTSGIRFSENQLWLYGAGLGTQFTFKNKFYGNVELTANAINKVGREQTTLNLLNRFNVNFGYQLAKHLAINAGPVLNIYTTKVFDSSTGVYGDEFGQSPFYSETFNGLNVSMWVGYALSIRF